MRQKSKVHLQNIWYRFVVLSQCEGPEASEIYLKKRFQGPFPGGFWNKMSEMSVTFLFYKTPQIFFDIHSYLNIISLENSSLAANSGIFKPYPPLSLSLSFFFPCAWIIQRAIKWKNKKAYYIKNKNKLKKKSFSPLKKAAKIVLNKLIVHKIFIRMHFSEYVAHGTKHLTELQG